jgi:gas vesicle protein
MTDSGNVFNSPLFSPRRHVASGLTLAMIILLILAGCQSTYYAVWEKMGKEKRHLLKDNVEQVREDQADASEQFASVVERIKAMYGFDGGELEAVYEKLSADFQACEERADAVRDRIDKVERIAADLFDEWASEIDTIENVKLRSKSRASFAGHTQPIFEVTAVHGPCGSVHGPGA